MKLDMSKLVLVFCLLTAGLQAQVAVVNSASFAPGQPVTTGSWAAAFGSFSGVITTAAATMPLPNTLAGVKITIEGVDAPLSDVRQSQITFLVPCSITAGVHPIVVTTPAGASNSFTANLAQFAPGLFPSAAPYVVAQHADSSYVTPASPARPGEVIILWGTGFGPGNPAVPSGQVFSGASKLVNNVNGTIGGQPAIVDFAATLPPAERTAFAEAMHRTPRPHRLLPLPGEPHAPPHP